MAGMGVTARRSASEFKISACHIAPFFENRPQSPLQVINA
jgi:hypothetical protein